MTQGFLDDYEGFELSTNLFGLNLNFGFYSFFRPSNPSKFYWGADIDLGVNHIHLNVHDNGYFNIESQNYVSPYINFAPQLGWMKEINSVTKINVHLNPIGLYATSTPKYQYSPEYSDRYGNHHYDYERYLYDGHGCPLDAYSKIGIGIWHKRMIYDISYRQPWINFPGTITFSVGYQF